MKKLKNNKVLNIIFTVIKTIIVITLLAFILVVFLQRFTNNKLSLFNYRIFAVATGSMKPKYNIGDVLLSKDVEPSKLKVGDNISYLGTQSNFKGKVITHQITKIETDENGKLLFHTKGIANLIEDPVVSESQIYGKVIYKTYFLSHVYKLVSTNTGFGLIIIIPLILIVGYEILITLLEKKEEEINAKRK